MKWEKRGKVSQESFPFSSKTAIHSRLKSCNIRNRWKEVISCYETTCAWKQSAIRELKSTKESQQRNWELSKFPSLPSAPSNFIPRSLSLNVRGYMKYYLQCHLFHLNFTTQKETAVIAEHEVMEKVTVKDMGEEKLVACLRSRRRWWKLYDNSPFNIFHVWMLFSAVLRFNNPTPLSSWSKFLYPSSYFAWYEISHVCDDHNHHTKISISSPLSLLSYLLST